MVGGYESPLSIHSEQRNAMDSPYHVHGASAQAENNIPQDKDGSLRVSLIIHQVSDYQNIYSIMSMNNWAIRHMLQTQWQDASKLLTKASTHSTQVLGARHAITLTCRNNLAISYIYGNQLSRGRKILRSALSAGKQEFGADHLIVTICTNNLADVDASATSPNLGATSPNLSATIPSGPRTERDIDNRNALEIPRNTPGISRETLKPPHRDHVFCIRGNYNLELF
ncbi:hypothetical protein CTheo_6947 [Ceratobasidium theobromae]|uniref:Uncharacterized protein n=1 Tax=Ceratobasidium theobromae TaxID=1582974 RepID=A0A5N5QDS9_9AGAM|nr:hypothetical protein CTheo_6947 [Ceratobasidium theobromae]